MTQRIKKAARIAGIVVVGLVAIAAVLFTVRYIGFRREVAQLNEAWAQDRPRALEGVGTTRTLTILPLVDFHASKPGLATDVGVSYLVKTDRATILFDVGNNTAGADPSPLETNLAALGVSLGDVDTVVISHAHFDHVGGRTWTNGGVSGTTFGFGKKQPSLAGKRVVVPIAMTYPGSQPEVATEAVRIAPGVATTGTIKRRLFGELVEEQALAVNVEGKGIVLVVGCGHQTVSRLLQRTHAVFPGRLAGLVGGLHFPVPHGRFTLAGIDAQRTMASGEGPFAPLSEQDVDAELALLEKEKLDLIGVGGHDSSDEVIEKVKSRFGAAHRYVRVGEPIALGAAQ